MVVPPGLAPCVYTLDNQLVTKSGGTQCVPYNPVRGTLLCTILILESVTGVTLSKH